MLTKYVFKDKEELENWLMRCTNNYRRMHGRHSLRFQSVRHVWAWKRHKKREATKNEITD